MALMRSLSYTLLFGTRGAAVFMLATATIGIKSGVFPRWFAITCYVLGAALLFGLVRGLGNPGAADLGRGREPVHSPARAIPPAGACRRGW